MEDGSLEFEQKETTRTKVWFHLGLLRSLLVRQHRQLN